MRDIFTAIFLGSLAVLVLAQALGPFSGVARVAACIMFLLSLAAAVLRRPMTAYILLVPAFALLIAARFLQQKENYELCRDTPVPQGDYVNIEGRLMDFPYIQPEHTLLRVRVDTVEFRKRRGSLYVIVQIRVAGHLFNHAPGERIRAGVRLQPLHWSRNFFRNPLQNHYFINRIHFHAVCKSAQLVEIREKAPLFWRIISRWRDTIRNFLSTRYRQPDRAPDIRGSLIEALLIGDRGRLPSPEREAFLKAGLYHVLAISGIHIGIIAVVLLALLRVAGVSMSRRYLVSGLFLLLFLILSGLQISAQRAVFMALLIFLARCRYTDFNIFNVISFSGVVILLLNPAQCFDTGFVLTYTLTFAIVIGRRIFLNWFNRLPVMAAEYLSANISANIVSWPLSLFFFKRYSLLGFVSGMLLIPLVAAVVSLCIPLVVFIPLLPAVASVFLAVAGFCLDLLLGGLHFLAHAVDANIYAASPSPVLTVVILALFFLLAMARRKRKTVVVIAAVLLLALMRISLQFPVYNPRHLEVFYLDVGQGDAQVVVFPGGKSLLLDGGGSYGGGFEVGRRVVLPFLLQKRIRIQWAAVSHIHPDHVRGVMEIIPVIRPRELWIPAGSRGLPLCRELLAAVPRSTRVIEVADGFRRRMGAAELQCLHPADSTVLPRTENNRSLVMAVSDGHSRFLFTGDIEKDVEQELSARFAEDLSAQVLKVPHHGSRTSSSAVFVQQVSPRIAVFSLARNNRFGFPDPAVVQRYRTLQVRLLMTHRSGGIRVVAVPGGFILETSR